MGYFSWILIQTFHCRCTNLPLISEYWLCILLFCQICLLSQLDFGGVWRVFYVHHHVICKQWQFCFLLSNLDAFYFFSCLIAVARTSNTMLNRHDESWHPCLAPDVSGKAFTFCPLSVMLAVGLTYMAFIRFSNAPPIPTLLSF